MSTSTARRLPRFGLAAKLLFLAGACLTLWLLGAALHSAQASADPGVPAGISADDTSSAPRADVPSAGLLHTVPATVRHGRVEPAASAARATLTGVTRLVVRDVVRPAAHDVVRPAVRKAIDHVVRPVVAHPVVDRIVRPVTHAVLDHVVRPVAQDVTPRPAIGEQGVRPADGPVAARHAAEQTRPAESREAPAVRVSMPVTTRTRVRLAYPAYVAVGPLPAVAHDAVPGKHEPAAPAAPSGPPTPSGGYSPVPSRASGPDLPILNARSPIPGDDDGAHVTTAAPSDDLLGALLRRPGFSPD